MSFTKKIAASRADAACLPILYLKMSNLTDLTNNSTGFGDRLEAVEEEIKNLIKSPEYRQMLKSGYNNRADLSLGDALLAVQECFNEYYVDSIVEDSPQSKNESDRLGRQGGFTRSISGYVNTDIPILAQLVRENGAELERMTASDKIFLISGLSEQLYESTHNKPSAKLQDSLGQLKQVVRQHHCGKELLKAIAINLITW